MTKLGKKITLFTDDTYTLSLFLEEAIIIWLHHAKNKVQTK